MNTRCPCIHPNACAFPRAAWRIAIATDTCTWKRVDAPRASQWCTGVSL